MQNLFDMRLASESRDQHMVGRILQEWRIRTRNKIMERLRIEREREILADNHAKRYDKTQP